MIQETLVRNICKAESLRGKMRGVYYSNCRVLGHISIFGASLIKENIKDINNQIRFLRSEATEQTP
jgi:hypothetical protein